MFCNYDNFDKNKKSILNLAVQKNDRLLVLQLKLYYNDITREEINELKKLTNKKYLPPLSKEFNKDYVIIGKVNYSLLRNSGYKILHQPYFAMQGSTHSKLTLNPHTKVGVDAAKVDEEGITFIEFLKLFGNDNPLLTNDEDAVITNKN